MKVRAVLRGLVIATILAMLGALLPQLASAAPEKASGRYLVRARSSADYAGLRAKAVKEGARVAARPQQANTMVVSATRRPRSSLAADRRTLGVARSRCASSPPRSARPTWTPPASAAPPRLKAKAPAATTAAGINPDPAFDYKGLLWDYRRIGLPQGWKTSAGSSAVTVGVADTGLDFTHRELASKVKQVVDFTGTRGPAHLQDLLRRLRRGPGGRVRRAGDHRLERARVLDRRPHRRRPQRHRHQRDRPQGQPGRPEDLPVVRLGLRRRASWTRS